MGLRLFLGLSAVPVRGVELLRRFWLGMGAGNGRMPAVVGKGILRRSQHRLCARRLSPSSAAASTASPDSRETDSDGCREPACDVRGFRAACAQRKYAGDDRREYRASASSGAFAAGIQRDISEQSKHANAKRADRQHASRDNNIRPAVVTPVPGYRAPQPAPASHSSSPPARNYSSSNSSSSGGSHSNSSSGGSSHSGGGGGGGGGHSSGGGGGGGHSGGGGGGGGHH